ncbi:Aconitase/3-isopropylmalate dehydratase large subunit alpha/beta/alpha subdomain 1/3 [Penicillium sp. IBT 18751x]|nr:Aconitase/3-isopropylmalate dehydratase large subunit alpha/beta/alpha subdomain 1/3 [Penicillium sp. IBT 18751x]
MDSIRAQEIIPGCAEGDLVASKVALSFWGGVSSQDGIVIDSHHPLVGKSIAGKILAIPSGRGSCTGSGVILELLLNGSAPCALIFGREEMILTIGVLVAQEMFLKSIPILQVPMSSFDTLMKLDRLRIANGQLQWGDSLSTEAFSQPATLYPSLRQPKFNTVNLTPFDGELLEGVHGEAAQVAMRVILRIAQIHRVTELIDVQQAHIDCCIYTGPATLRFAQKLCDMGAKVRIPTSLNSISIDRRLWRSQGVDPDIGEPSEQLAEAYLRMGAQPTFTCAPYLLDTAPKAGENIMWAESNAVVFANSVLGARTIKCPDYLDVCVSLTGRALNTGCHLTENRKARVEVHLKSVHGTDDTFFALLGYLAGDIAADSVPIITGMEKMEVTMDDLKAFGAAFATTSSAPMFHIAGITIEARSLSDIAAHLKDSSKVTITLSELGRQWLRFSPCEGGETSTAIDLVSLGNPHFSFDEIVKLVRLCAGRKKNQRTTLVVTCNRDTYSKAAKEGHIVTLDDFGVQVLTDTCWCMIQEPVIPLHAQTIVTNSAKYAHYGKGLTGRKVWLRSLTQCVDAACSGSVQNSLPAWLGGTGPP